jgi:hypothetical protein
MNKLEAPKGYELQTSRDYYDHYISRGDDGIIGGVLDQNKWLIVDYFSNGQIIEFSATSLAEAVKQIELYQKTKNTGEF